MVVFMSCFVFAEDYQTNETIRIDAIYTEAGVLSEADENLTIENPNDDIVLNNVGMNESSTGVFYYDYLIPMIEGEYRATVRFYVNGTLQGLDTQLFTVGGEKLSFGTCPSNDKLNFLWFVIILGVLMYLLGIFFPIPFLSAVGGLFIIFSSLYFFACAFFIGIMVLSLGMFLTIHGLMRKS
jgi:hypothetical protein